MRAWRKKLFGRANAGVHPVLQKNFFPLLAAASLLFLLLLARHTSTDPAILGRWSPRYAGLLAFQSAITIAFALLCIPALKSPLLRRREWTESRRKAWSLLIAGLALLPALWLLMRKVLFPAPDPVLALFASLILVAAVAMVTAVMWYSGATALTVSLSPYTPLLLLLLIAGQLFLTALFSGQVPSYDLVDEIQTIGNSLRQVGYPDRFVQLWPERNSSTWFYFNGYWVFSGAWMKIFGAGFQQLRFLNLLVAWLGVPFLFLTARKLFGPVAALIAAVCGIVFPMHFVAVRSDIWVATATAIALYCFLVARKPKTSRVRLPAFLCGLLAISAIDGHFYGSAFALVFCLLHVPLLVRTLRGRSGRQEQKIVTGFLAGLLVYSLVWFSWHIILPGVNPASLPEVLQATVDVEAGYGESSYGTGPTNENLIKFIQTFLYRNPYVFVTSLLGMFFVFHSGGSQQKTTLIVAIGAGITILLTLVHSSKHYSVFWFPFMCLWTGAGLSKLFPLPGKPEFRNRTHLSPGTLYLVLALVLLCTIQLVETAEIYRDSYQRAWQLTDIGREIDRMLPREDMVVAGTQDIYLGMLWRLNYGVGCGFTLDDPKYWPLEQPQAVIFTPGRDKACETLSDWLLERDFRPARCFRGHDLGEGVTILYMSPELMTQEAAIDCSPEDLAWLRVPA